MNQALFREVNERIFEITNALDGDADPEGSLELFCECGSADCTQRLRLDAAEYREVRARSDRFVVAHGHADEELERVVERRRGYEVVELRPSEAP